MRVLFLSADPTDASRLRVQREIREIRDCIRLHNSTGVDLVEEWAVRPSHLQAALRRVAPDIVHYSGHGYLTGSLALEGSDGRSKPVRPSALAELFNLLPYRVKGVLLNACHSSSQVRALLQVVDFAIIMRGAIDDDSAIAFSAGFYEALASGDPPETAFQFGRNRIRLEGLPSWNIPQLRFGKAVSGPGGDRGLLPAPSATTDNELQHPSTHYSAPGSVATPEIKNPYTQLSSNRKASMITESHAKSAHAGTNDSVRIVLVGHTSAGKTTLIRTLVRRAVGTISHSANTTQHQDPIPHEDLQATFVDTPGFQSATAFKRDVDKGIPLDESDEDLKYDIRASRAVAQSDVALYVADVSTTPDRSHEHELALTVMYQPRVVVVGNKLHAHSEDQRARQEAAGRRDDWQRVFTKNGLARVIWFDAHFDDRNKIDDLYRQIREALPDHRRDAFDRGIARFRDRQNGILAAMRQACFDKYKSAESMSEQTSTSQRSIGENRLDKNLSQLSGELVIELSKIVAIAARHPTSFGNELEGLLLDTSDGLDVAIASGISGGIGALIGGALGAAAGAIAAAVGTGGIAAPAGAIIGAEWGAGVAAAILAILGGVGASESRTVYASQNTLERVLKGWCCICWGLSNFGFGQSDSVLPQDIERWLNYRPLIAPVQPRNGYFALAKSQPDFEQFMDDAMGALNETPITA